MANPTLNFTVRRRDRFRGISPIAPRNGTQDLRQNDVFFSGSFSYSSVVRRRLRRDLSWHLLISGAKSRGRFRLLRIRISQDPRLRRGGDHRVTSCRLEKRVGGGRYFLLAPIKGGRICKLPIFMPCWLPPPPKGRRGAILLRELCSGVGHKSSSTRSRHRRGHRPHSVDPGVQDSYSIYDKTPHFTLQFKCEEPYICT